MSFSREETILTCRLNNIISDEKHYIIESEIQWIFAELEKKPF
jgi:hypothetical protein